jgi:hypothetical protein
LGARRTRKGFLRIAAGGGAQLALGALAACEPDPRIRASASPGSAGRRWAFRSRPDLSPPPVEVLRRSRGVAQGYLFTAPKNGLGEEYPAQDGPMILDGEGRPVWFRPVPEEGQDAMDFKVQRYRGEPVLSWWQGVHGGWGEGEYLIFDRSYREVARVRAGNGLAGDHHEFFVTERDTALFTIYRGVPMDLSAAGGPKQATVMDGIVQEVDIETGEVLFEWHSLEHVGFEESTAGPNPDQRDAYDYFHINSVAEDNVGNLLVGARKTSAIYKVDRESGEVIWRLGGNRSNFVMGEGDRFAFQHDARRHRDGTITIFDNRGADMDEPSRGIRLEFNEEAMTAELIEALTGALLKEISAPPGELDLVLDDYHRINSEDVHRAVSLLLEHLPEGVHLVVSSRVDPPLPLTRLRARSQMAELGAAELAFSREEAGVFAAAEVQHGART